MEYLRQLNFARFITCHGEGKFVSSLPGSAYSWTTASTGTVPGDECIGNPPPMDVSVLVNRRDVSNDFSDAAWLHTGIQDIPNTFLQETDRRKISLLGAHAAIGLAGKFRNRVKLFLDPLGGYKAPPKRKDRFLPLFYFSSILEI